MSYTIKQEIVPPSEKIFGQSILSPNSALDSKKNFFLKILHKIVPPEKIHFACGGHYFVLYSTVIWSSGPT